MSPTILTTLLAAFLFTGCQQAKVPDHLEGVVVDFQIAPTPPKVGPAKATVQLHTDDGKPIQGASIKLEGNMSHAGMTPVFADAHEVEAGRYEATLQLTMRGDWFVIFDATLPDGRKLSRKVDVPGVKSR